MTLASRLDKAMQKAGITSQGELARRSGISQPTINRILKGIGKTAPSSSTVSKLAGACNVSMEWLMEEHGSIGDDSPLTARRSQLDLGGLLIGQDVIELLTNFAASTEEGRRFILESAQVAEKRRDSLIVPSPIVNDKS